jgi:hypothetical protein
MLCGLRDAEDLRGTVDITHSASAISWDGRQQGIFQCLRSTLTRLVVNDNPVAVVRPWRLGTPGDQRIGVQRGQAAQQFYRIFRSAHRRWMRARQRHIEFAKQSAAPTQSDAH